MQSLVRDLGGPTALREIGFAETDIGRAADLAVARAYPNPREVTRAGVTALLHRALNGDCGQPVPTGCWRWLRLTAG